MKIITILTLFFSLQTFASHFEVGSDVPTNELIEELQKVYDTKIKGKNVESVKVEGHTDSRGSDAYNQNLSERRSKMALQTLQNMGLEQKVKSETIGQGERQLISLGLSEEDHSKNRRVVILVKSEDGESKTVISEYKEPQVIYKEKIVIKKVRKNNRISLLGVQGFSDLSVSNSQSNTTVSNRVHIKPAAMYQRMITEDVSLSVGSTLKLDSFMFGAGYDF